MRRCESLILDEVTDLREHGSLPVGRYRAPSWRGDSEKPAGQTGSSGNPEGDHAVLFWYITLKIRRRCVEIRDGILAEN